MISGKTTKVLPMTKTVIKTSRDSANTSRCESGVQHEIRAGNTHRLNSRAAAAYTRM